MEMNIFGVESGLMRAVAKFTDCLILSLLFLVSCVPVITAGAAWAALYHTANKVIRQDRSYVVREYFDSFKDNFKRSVPAFLLAAALGAVIFSALYLLSDFAHAGGIRSFAYAALMVVSVFWAMWVSYLFPILARFGNAASWSMKQALLMPVESPFRTILAMLFLAACVAVFLFVPLLLVVLPAVYALLVSFPLEGAFRKHEGLREN